MHDGHEMKRTKVATLHKKPVLLRSPLVCATGLKCMESGASKHAAVLVASDKVVYNNTAL